MLCRSVALGSNPFAHNPRKKIPGFYKPFMGASLMKSYYKPTYKRLSNSLHHYPEVSRVSGKPIDYLYDKPKSGYEYQKIYGDNTLELKGMPSRRTPEYMQERLRRFFSKFGRVVTCRCLPHPLDPYQCEGTAYVSFREKKSCFDALKAPLQFPVSLQSKTVSMRYMAEDKINDRKRIDKVKHWNSQLVSIARQLYTLLTVSGPKPLESVACQLIEIPFGGKAPETAEVAVYEIFREWETFLRFEQCAELFHVHQNMVHARLVNEIDRILVLLNVSLARKMREEISIDWRAGKPELPSYVRRQIRKWDHKDPLPFQLQILSRNSRSCRVFDERFLVKVKANLEKAKRKREKRAERAKTEAADLKARAEKKLAARSRFVSLPN